MPTASVGMPPVKNILKDNFRSIGDWIRPIYIGNIKMKIRRNIAFCLTLIMAVSFAMVGRTAAADNKNAGGEKEQKLIKVLQSNAPPQDKAITCKQLAICGTKDAVPALAAILSDKDLASWARIALEAIPDSAADDALRGALDKVQGRLLVGVINSIGVRRDAKAVDALAQRLADADAEVASSSAVALGRIGGDSAAKKLESFLAGAPPAVRSAIAQGCVLCAEKYLAEGKRAEAIKLYDLVRNADVPKQRVLEAIRGAILARQADGVPLLAEQLKSPNKALFGIGLSVARELPGPKVTEALVAELSKATPDRQVLLILALADRGDATTSPAVLEAAKSGPNNVRIAAIRVLQRQGDVACVALLLDAAIGEDTELSQAAATALAELPGKAVDADLVARLQNAAGETRMILIEIAGQRRIEAALPILLKAADDSESQVRAAALAAMGSVVTSQDLPLLIDRAVKPRDPQDAKAAENALRAACIRMADREACAEKLSAALPTADVAAKCRLLAALGAMGGENALKAVAAAGKDPSPEIQDVASRVLGEWMSADAGPALLDMAKSAGDEKYKTRAVRGYIRLARQLKLPAETRLDMFRAAMEAAKRNEEKRLALEILTRIPTAATLQLAVSHSNDPALKDAAADAAVKIAGKIVGSEPRAVAEAMDKIVALGFGGNVGNRAKQLLDQAKSGANPR
jgi:HEAT repeat protein